MPYVGKSVRAIEDVNLIRGEGLYIDDIKLKNTLHLHFVRSPYAHAFVKNVDVSDLVEKSRLVVVGKDLDRMFGDTLLPARTYPGANIAKMPALATKRVNFVGQPVVGLVAGDRYAAEDMAESVFVEYERLQPVLDPWKAMEDDTPIIHEELGTNISVNALLKGGDVEQAFRNAHLVVEDELSIHRVASNPIEPRGVVVRWDGSRFNVWASCQGVFRLREGLSEALNVSEDKIRVFQADVGGAFGSKTPPYPEYVVACYAAYFLKRPIKWIESRSEHLVATYHGRDVRAKIALATNRNGRVLGLKAKVMADIGAYNFWMNSNYSPFIAQQLTGPYNTEAAEVKVLSVFTNKTPLGPYRGAGRPEAAFLYERMLDLLADELKMDRAELRLKNFVHPEDMPYRTALGLTLDVESYPSIFRGALEKFGYRRLKRWVGNQRSRSRCLGLGLANYIELSRASWGEGALVRLEKNGDVTVITGLGPHGQAHRTILCQLVADELELDIENVRVLYGDSDLLPRGHGTSGSRSAVIGGAAAVQAARALKGRVIESASKVLRLEPEGLEYGKGLIRSKKGREASVALADLAKRVRGLEAFIYCEGKDIFSFGVHLALAEVDRETGRAKVLQYMAADDAGRVINPLLSEGQIFGGVMQGVGQVLYEEMLYGEDGQPLIGGIGDAGVPTAAEGVKVKSLLMEFPSGFPHGARGIGEAGCIGALPAVVSAIEDAIGTRVRTTLMKPEAVLNLLKQRNRAASSSKRPP